MKNRLGPVAVPAAVVAIILMMVVPLPHVLLDLLLAINISLALLMLLTSMFVKRALDFSVFPSLLLVATMFRLALNVSSTRLVLLEGYAGKVIESFGNFVIGGSVVVGLVIFLILVVIQFMVITAGAGRVAEVGARFTLDAMPGKQMAIDADLNSGLIDEETARTRRADVAAEADFYGAMDGASKFVKGDAIAGIIICIVNLFGGFIIGVVQRGLPFGEAIQTYSLLTVGDGLVSQIPALLISIASGLIVTRAATDGDMGTDILGQFGRQAGAIKLAGVAIATLAIIPGLPKLPFLGIGAMLFFVGGRLPNREELEATAAAAALPAVAERPAADSVEAIAGDMRVEPLELEIAYDLMDLVDPARGGDLLDRVKALRRKIAMDLGMVIPLVRTRDNLDLPAGHYAIKVHGVELGRGEAPPGAVLVIGDALDQLPGVPTKEPVFGLDAIWVPTEFRHQAELLGATVVDRSSVITTHLAEVVRTNAGRLLSRQDVRLLLDGVKSTDPAVAEELTGANISLGEVQRVLSDLLDEGVAIRDLVRILEAVSERGRVTKDPEVLVESVRHSLGPAISSAYAVEGRLAVLTFEPMVEHAMLESLRTGEAGSFLALDPTQAEHLAMEVARVAQTAEQRGENPVLMCAANLRPAVRRLIRNIAPGLPVLSYTELSPQLRVETIGVVSLGSSVTV
jgi:flagellar biosynthesis protein FlhA